MLRKLKAFKQLAKSGGAVTFASTLLISSATPTLLIASAPTARADGNCAYVGNGVVCLNVQNDLFDQQRVISVNIQRTLVGDPHEIGICNYTASDLSVTTPGVPYPSDYPPLNPPAGQCVPGAAEISYPAYNISYPAPGTTFCAQWFENDEPIGTVVCEQQ